MRNRHGRSVAGRGWFGVTLLALSLTGCTALGTELGFATGSAVVSWVPPTTTANGTKLTNLAGYDLYYGRSPSALICRVKIADIHATRHVVRRLSGGRWYFVVTAYTTTGAQSVPSNVVSKTMPGPEFRVSLRGRGRCEFCGTC